MPGQETAVGSAESIPEADSAAVRWKQFRRLWGAHSISELGSQVTLLALPVTAVLTLGATPGEMGVLTAAGLAPYPLLALPLGAMIDRLPHRRMMVLASLARLCLLVTIPIAAALDVLTVVQLGVIAFLTGAFTVLFDLAKTAQLPALVGQEQIVPANSRLSLSSSIAGLSGPGLGGALVQLITAPVTMLLEVVSLGVSALLIHRIRVPGGGALPPRPRQERPSLRRDMLEGWRYVVRMPVLRAAALTMAVVNFAGYILVAVLLIYVTKDLHVPVGLLGVLMAMAGIGAVPSALLAPVLIRRFGLGPVSALGAVLMGLGPLLLPFAHSAGIGRLFLVGGSQFILGAGVGLVDIAVLSLRQSLTPDHLQARTAATIRMVQWGAKPLGSLAGGFLGGFIGLRPTLWVAVGVGVLGALWMVLSPVAKVRTPLPR